MLALVAASATWRAHTAQTKIISDPSDRVGVVFYNTVDTSITLTTRFPTTLAPLPLLRLAAASAPTAPFLESEAE
jgi:hypothetical protein